MSTINLTEETILAAEKGDSDALKKVLEFFESDIQTQCASCKSPEIAAEKREYIVDYLIKEILTEWPQIRKALEKSLK